MRQLIVILAFAAHAGATDYSFTKKIHPGDLQAQIVAGGITVEHIGCSGNKCTVFNASADPSAIIAAYVFMDPMVKVQTNRTAAIALVKKLRASTATQAEKDELLGRLSFMLLGE